MQSLINSQSADDMLPIKITDTTALALLSVQLHNKNEVTIISVFLVDQWNVTVQQDG